jgi:hypothetical protein
MAAGAKASHAAAFHAQVEQLTSFITAFADERLRADAVHMLAVRIGARICRWGTTEKPGGRPLCVLVAASQRRPAPEYGEENKRLRC